MTIHIQDRYKEIGPHVQWTLVLLSEALLAHDVHVRLERLSGALPPEVVSPDPPRVAETRPASGVHELYLALNNLCVQTVVRIQGCFV